MKKDIAGVLVDDITSVETIQKIDEFVRSDSPHYIVTTYSEFVVQAQKDPAYKDVLNRADISLPDGIGILWAAKYLSLNSPHVFGAFIRIISTGASLVFNPKSAQTVIREKVSGSKLIWDIAKLASEKNYSMALVGGGDSVAAQSAEVLKAKFPNLRINLAISGGKPFDEQTVSEIRASNSDILCVAYQPPKQEIWIAHNLQKFNTKVAIGLGGTFDYLTGKRITAPSWMVNLGLEWLWRLITQPWRIKRMWNAIVVFILVIYKHRISNLNAKSTS